MSNSPRILVVEDDPDGQELVAHILGYLKFEIDVANDGDEAVTILHESGKTFDGIIIDLNLPGKNGWEVLTYIQTNAKTANIPCLAVTAHHTSKLREEAIKAGFTAYFAKPLDASSFARQLEEIL